MSCPAGPRRAIEREMIFNHSFSLDPKAARVDKGTWYRLSWQRPIGLTCLQKPRSTKHSLQSLLVSFPVDLGREGLIHNLTAGTMKAPQLPQRQWLWGAAAPEGAGCHQSGVPTSAKCRGRQPAAGTGILHSGVVASLDVFGFGVHLLESLCRQQLKNN